MKYLQKTNVEMIIATTTIAATTATAIIATLGTAGILFASTDKRKKTISNIIFLDLCHSAW